MEVAPAQIREDCQQLDQWILQTLNAFGTFPELEVFDLIARDFAVDLS